MSSAVFSPLKSWSVSRPPPDGRNSLLLGFFFFLGGGAEKAKKESRENGFGRFEMVPGLSNVFGYC